MCKAKPAGAIEPRERAGLAAEGGGSSWWWQWAAATVYHGEVAPELDREARRAGGRIGLRMGRGTQGVAERCEQRQQLQQLQHRLLAGALPVCLLRQG